MITPTTEPIEFTAGDTLNFERSLAEYPAGEYTLAYVLHNASKLYKIDDGEITASGSAHVVTVAATTTANWVAGDYQWEAFATKGSDRYRAASGRIKILANPLAANADALDGRTQNRRTLEAVRDCLEKLAGNDVKGYAIGGRQFTKRDIPELQTMERTYAWRVAREEKRAPKFIGASFGGHRYNHAPYSRLTDES